jgi:hypothetical protein
MFTGLLYGKITMVCVCCCQYVIVQEIFAEFILFYLELSAFDFNSFDIRSFLPKKN